MTIALMIIADGAVQTHVWRLSDSIGVSNWALARMGPGAYFGRVGDQIHLERREYGIYRLHSSVAEGVVMVQP